MVISSDGEYVASESIDGTICIWHAQTGLKGWTLHAPGADRFESVAFFPDGKHIASSSLPDNRVRVWDVTIGAQISSSVLHNGIECMALSPNGAQLATGHWDTTIALWNK